MFELFLFENDVQRAKSAVAAGISNFLVDWEYMGKDLRQMGYDTEILAADPNDLHALCEIENSTVWCRINQYGSHSKKEIDRAIRAGAQGIFLPMVRSCAEVEEFLSYVNGRCETGILIETTEAYHAARELSKLPFERVYFGLNDYAISRGGGSIFQAVKDGSVERIREIFSDKVFGFGGVTAIDAGNPVPAKHLLQEMSRLNCHFSFMRRSFRRDTEGKEMAPIITEIHEYLRQCHTRDEATIGHHHIELNSILNDVCRQAIQ